MSGKHTAGITCDSEVCLRPRRRLSPAICCCPIQHVCSSSYRSRSSGSTTTLGCYAPDSEHTHINLLACLQLHLRCCHATGVCGARPAASCIILAWLVLVARQLDIRCCLCRACASHLLLAALSAAAPLVLLPAAVQGWPDQTGPHPHPPSGEQAAVLTCNTTGVGLLAAMQPTAMTTTAGCLCFAPTAASRTRADTEAAVHKHIMAHM